MNNYDLEVKGSFQTKNQTNIYWWVEYVKGKGYQMCLVRNPDNIAKQTDLNSMNGGVKALIVPCQRQSKKKLEEALQEVQNKAANTVSFHFPNL